MIGDGVVGLMRIARRETQGRRIKTRRGAILDCGGTTPLWLHRPND
jgi:hypothetical protein